MKRNLIMFALFAAAACAGAQEFDSEGAKESYVVEIPAFNEEDGFVLDSEEVFESENLFQSEDSVEQDVAAEIQVEESYPEEESASPVLVDLAGAQAPSGIPALENIVSEKVLGIPLEMAMVEGGSFCMGEVKDFSSKNAHVLSVQKFLMSRTEVNQELYHAIVGKDPSAVKGNKYPVTNVSWYDAIYFCNKLSMAQGYTPCYSVNGLTNPDTWNYSPQNSSMIQGEVKCNYSADGYRLPTEAEWEYAATGGPYLNQFDFSGSNEAAAVAVFSDTQDGIQLAGSLDCNVIGLFDMSGNASEWCWDWYGKAYPAKDSYNPTGPLSGSQKLVRGGSYKDLSSRSAVYQRSSIAPSNRLDNVGFRIVRHVLTERELAIQNASMNDASQGLSEEEIEFLKKKDSAKRKSLNFTVALMKEKESLDSVYADYNQLLDFADGNVDYMIGLGFCAPISNFAFWGANLGMSYMTDSSSASQYSIDAEGRIGLNTPMFAKDTLRLSAYLEAGYMNFGLAYGLGLDLEIMGIMTERNFGLGVDLFAAYDLQWDGKVHQAKAGCNIEILLPNVKRVYK